MGDLTDRQRAVLAYVLDRLGEGMAPTLRDVAASVGSDNVNAGRVHLLPLVRKGYLAWHTPSAYSTSGVRAARSLRPGPRLAGVTVSREGGGDGVVVVRRDGVPVLRLALGQAGEVAALLVRAAGSEKGDGGEGTDGAAALGVGNQ